MKTIEEIYNGMLEVFRRETGAEASGVSDLSVRLYAVAAQIYGLYVQEDWLARQCFPQTAEGEYLDRHAALRGLERRSALAAVGSLRFLTDQPAAADLAIPAGTVCATAGLRRFETVEPGTLAAGSTFADVAARAVEPGLEGNVPAGTVLSMTVPPVGVSRCINPAAFSGGTDREDDETLRARVLETFRRMPNGANAAFYEQTALAFEEVAAAAVLPRSRGRGTVDVIISTSSGQPDSGLLAAVQARMEQVREIAVDVQVKAPVLRTADVALTVTARPGARTDLVQKRVEQTIRDFFTGQRLSRGVMRAELNHLAFSDPDVINCTVRAPAADLAAKAGELPRLGTLTVEVVR